jgi:hypothetical protein
VVLNSRRRDFIFEKYQSKMYYGQATAAALAAGGQAATAAPVDGPEARRLARLAARKAGITSTPSPIPGSIGSSGGAVPSPITIPSATAAYAAAVAGRSASASPSSPLDFGDGSSVSSATDLFSGLSVGSASTPVTPPRVTSTPTPFPTPASPAAPIAVSAMEARRQARLAARANTSSSPWVTASDLPPPSANIAVPPPRGGPPSHSPPAPPAGAQQVAQLLAAGSPMDAFGLAGGLTSSSSGDAGLFAGMSMSPSPHDTNGGGVGITNNNNNNGGSLDLNGMTFASPSSPGLMDLDGLSLHQQPALLTPQPSLTSGPVTLSPAVSASSYFAPTPPTLTPNPSYIGRSSSGFDFMDHPSSPPSVGGHWSADPNGGSGGMTTPSPTSANGKRPIRGEEDIFADLGASSSIGAPTLDTISEVPSIPVPQPSPPPHVYGSGVGVIGNGSNMFNGMTTAATGGGGYDPTILSPGHQVSIGYAGMSPPPPFNPYGPPPTNGLPGPQGMYGPPSATVLAPTISNSSNHSSGSGSGSGFDFIAAPQSQSPVDTGFTSLSPMHQQQQHHGYNSYPPNGMAPSSSYGNGGAALSPHSSAIAAARQPPVAATTISPTNTNTFNSATAGMGVDPFASLSPLSPSSSPPPATTSTSGPLAVRGGASAFDFF